MRRSPFWNESAGSITARQIQQLQFRTGVYDLTASRGFAATIDGLNVVYRVREMRPVWKTRPLL